MPRRMWEAAVRAASLVGGWTPFRQTNWCLHWCCRTVYGHNGPYRWGGNGKPWAINYWDAAKRWGRVVRTSDPHSIPAGAMTFSKGAVKYGHVFIADGHGGCYTTDFPRKRKIGHVSIDALMRAWGHTLLGYIEVTGDGVDFRNRGPADRMDPRNYGPGHAGDHITWLGKRLAAHGFDRYYSSGPGPVWGEADRENVQAFQRAQGWRGAAADGLPGRETLRRLAAEPKVAAHV